MVAVKSIDSVQERIRELQAELAADPRQQELQILLEAENKLLELENSGRKYVNGGLSRITSKHLAPPASPSKGKQPKGTISQTAAAKLAVEDAGHPLETTALVAALSTYGAEISKENAERNLTSVLSKRGELVSVRWRDKRGWWPKGKELPQ